MESIRIYSLTFNVNGRPPPENFDCSRLLNVTTESKNDMPDVYAIGFQEVNSRLDHYLYDAFVSGEDPWTASVRSFLSSRGYFKVKSVRLLGIVLSVFCLRKHVHHVRNMETNYTSLSLGGMVGFKGGVTIRLTLYGVSLCFVNSHLSAHDNLLDRRVEEYNQIMESQEFKQEYTTRILYHDYIFWLGDLNFRLKENSITGEEIVEAVKEKKFSELLANDQLVQVMNEERAFHELNETLPNFPPTYKFIIGTSEYDLKRRPAWCDRILYRVNDENYENVHLELDQTSYTSHTEKIYESCSDHRPVSSEFSILVFGSDLARQRRIDDYNTLINFMFPGGPLDYESAENVSAVDLPDWYVNEDAFVKYTVEPGAGLYLSAWDWIGMYKEGFTALDEYICYCWASTERRAGIPRTALMSDSSFWTVGRYVLVYMSAKQSVLGISRPFFVGKRDEGIAVSLPRVETAEEAFEDQHRFIL